MDSFVRKSDQEDILPNFEGHCLVEIPNLLESFKSRPVQKILLISQLIMIDGE